MERLKRNWLIVLAACIFAVCAIWDFAHAAPPAPPGFDANQGACAFSQPKVYLDVFPDDPADTKEFSIYANGTMFMRRPWSVNGVNRQTWWLIDPVYLGTPVVLDSTVRNFADEESPDSNTVTITINACPPGMDAVDDLTVIALECDKAQLFWTPPSSDVEVYRISRVADDNAVDLDEYKGRNFYSFHVASVSLTGLPLPTYQDPPDAYPDKFYTIKEPPQPGQGYCYAVESWKAGVEVSEISNVACVTLPECP